jgi:glutathione S-transferase
MHGLEGFDPARAGKPLSYYFPDGPLTRVHYIIGRDEGATPERFPYLQRHLARIDSCLDWLEDRATADGFVPGWFSIMDINLMCPVLYAEKRKIFTLQGRPKLASILSRFAGRPSIVSTPVSAVGGRVMLQPVSG